MFVHNVYQRKPLAYPIKNFFANKDSFCFHCYKLRHFISNYFFLFVMNIQTIQQKSENGGKRFLGTATEMVMPTKENNYFINVLQTQSRS